MWVQKIPMTQKAFYAYRRLLVRANFKRWPNVWKLARIMVLLWGGKLFHQGFFDLRLVTMDIIDKTIHAYA